MGVEPPLQKTKAAVIFDNFGPYHLARLQAAATVSDLLAVEVTARSAEYAWQREAETGKQKAEDRNERRYSVFKRVTLLEPGHGMDVPRGEVAARLNRILDGFEPQVVFIPGWSSIAALAALRWSSRNGVPAAVMSESTEWDERRVWWKEWMKRKMVGLCAAALVGGSPHKDYILKLGMPAERIFVGYDAVDNDYFSAKAEEIRKQKIEYRKRYELPENYFLASARFIGKKNLPRLIEAHAIYRRMSEAGSKKPAFSPRTSAPGHPPHAPWSLVLLGDGPLRAGLRRLISDLRMDACVHLAGFIQYPDLPAYYGLAGAFIHASTTEQWGLVVNEAMASGLPVLVSNRCGCARDLVQEGVNGFTFDPYNVEQMAQLMLKISAFDFPLSTFGSESQRIISNWGLDRFAQGLKAAAEFARKAGSRPASLPDRALLEIMVRR